MRHLLPLALLLNASLASSAAFSGRLPVAPVAPALPSVKLPLLPLTTLPGVSFPAPHGGVNLPGKPVPLPLPVPIEVAAPAATPEAAASAKADEGFFLRWDLLEGEDDGLAGAFVPVDPGPRPLPPAGAMVQLRRAEKAAAEVFEAARVPVFVR